MILREVLAALPSGLHDAQLKALGINYEQGFVEMLVNVSVGDPSSASVERREAMRLASIRFHGLYSCVIEAPEMQRLLEGPVGIDGGELPHSNVVPPFDVGRLPKDVQACWLFVEPTNSFIFIVARSIALAWVEA